MKRIIGLIFFLAVLLIACGKEKKPTNSSPPFAFSSFHGRCKNSLGKIAETWGNGKLILCSFNDTIRIVHSNAYCYCCSDIKTEVKKTEQGFDAFEKDFGDSCNCMCYFDITSYIYNLNAGAYLIRLFDVTGNLLDQGFVVIREQEHQGPGS
jgi:hypothetical protein